MKYRHSYHAGNFADVHKHVTVLALLSALQRKDKGFQYLETHSGRGAYDLSGAAEAEAEAGVQRLSVTPNSAEELQRYAAAVAKYRAQHRNPRAYPGSPLLAAHALRPQDRAVFIELLQPEARALELALANTPRVRVEHGDGFDRLRAWLPPPERRGFTLIDPPYEEGRDFDRVSAAIHEASRRFQTGVVAAWYPIKDERDTSAWQTALVRSGMSGETLAAEIWLYPRDSRVSLNGSGMLIVNPPYLLAERMRVWLPELQAQLAHGSSGLDTGKTGGTSIRTLLPA